MVTAGNLIRSTRKMDIHLRPSMLQEKMDNFLNQVSLRFSYNILCSVMQLIGSSHTNLGRLWPSSLLMQDLIFGWATIKVQSTVKFTTNMIQKKKIFGDLAGPKWDFTMSQQMSSSLRIKLGPKNYTTLDTSKVQPKCFMHFQS